MDTRALLTDTAARMFADHCDKDALDAAERGEFPQRLLDVLVENGLHEMALSASGVPLADVFAVFKVAGAHAAPLHVPELVLGNRWRGTPSTALSIGRRSVTGAADVPWGRQAEVVLAVDGTGVIEIVPDGCEAATNLAGESRDAIAGSAGARLDVDEAGQALLALARTLQMAGALETVLELCLRYAGEREQFGRPLSRFQAIQHNLAVMATEVAAAGRAADAAADMLEVAAAERATLEVAAAKARVGEACGIVAEMAHQVHGAMGYTYEHQLHHFTRRLWAWRDEHGTETHWQMQLGRHVAALGAEGVWDFVATRG